MTSLICSLQRVRADIGEKPEAPAVDAEHRLAEQQGPRRAEHGAVAAEHDHQVGAGADRVAGMQLAAMRGQITKAVFQQHLSPGIAQCIEQILEHVTQDPAAGCDQSRPPY
jgi:hypothetical protein